MYFFIVLSFVIFLSFCHSFYFLSFCHSFYISIILSFILLFIVLSFVLFSSIFHSVIHSFCLLFYHIVVYHFVIISIIYHLHSISIIFVFLSDLSFILSFYLNTVVCLIILAVFLLILFVHLWMYFCLREEKSTQSLMRWWSVSCVTHSPCSLTTTWSATTRAAVRAPVAVVTAATGPTWTAGSEANADQAAHTTSCALHAGKST